MYCTGALGTDLGSAKYYGKYVYLVVVLCLLIIIRMYGRSMTLCVTPNLLPAAAGALEYTSTP